MDSRTESAPPKWAAAYLQFDAWTQDELRTCSVDSRPSSPTIQLLQITNRTDNARDGRSSRFWRSQGPCPAG